MSDAAQKAMADAVLACTFETREDAERLATRILAVLSETHAVVELPEALDRDDASAEWAVSRHGTVRHAVIAEDGIVLDIDHWSAMHPDEARDVAAAILAAVRFETERAS